MLGLETLLLAILGALVAVAAAFFGGRSKGKTEARRDQAEARAKSVTTARRVENEVAGQAPEDRREELKRWKG